MSVPTPPTRRSLSYGDREVCTVLDFAKWQVAWQTRNSACFVWSPQLCCQSVPDGCKLMLISFCWSAYSNSLPGFPFWYARVPVGYVIELGSKKDFLFHVRRYSFESQQRWSPFLPREQLWHLGDSPAPLSGTVAAHKDKGWFLHLQPARAKPSFQLAHKRALPTWTSKQSIPLHLGPVFVIRNI